MEGTGAEWDEGAVATLWGAFLQSLGAVGERQEEGENERFLDPNCDKRVEDVFVRGWRKGGD